MQAIYTRTRLGVLILASAALVATFGFAQNARACPNDFPIQRAGSGPYAYVWDHRITNTPGVDPEHLDPSGGRNASLALSDTGIIAVAYERPDPENEGGNALSLQRFNVNTLFDPNPPECVCDLDPVFPFTYSDDCPFRLDDKPTDGTLFSHVSLAVGREGVDQNHAGRVFATWLSRPPAQTPARVVLPYAYELRETPAPDTIPFSHSYFGPAPASSGGNNDFGPSAAIQPARESVGLTSRLRTPATDRRGLIHESQLSSSVTEDRSGVAMTADHVPARRWRPARYSFKSGFHAPRLDELTVSHAWYGASANFLIPLPRPSILHYDSMTLMES